MFCQKHTPPAHIVLAVAFAPVFTVKSHPIWTLLRGKSLLT